MTLRHVILFATTLPVLTACGAAPQLKAHVSPEALRADYPALVPAEALRAQAKTGPLTAQETQIADQLDARAASLKARAARLRGSVISESEKERLQAEVKIDEKGT